MALQTKKHIVFMLVMLGTMGTLQQSLAMCWKSRPELVQDGASESLKDDRRRSKQQQQKKEVDKQPKTDAWGREYPPCDVCKKAYNGIYQFLCKHGQHVSCQECYKAYPKCIGVRRYCPLCHDSKELQNAAREEVERGLRRYPFLGSTAFLGSTEGDPSMNPLFNPTCGTYMVAAELLSRDKDNPRDGIRLLAMAAKQSWSTPEHTSDMPATDDDAK